MPINDYDGTSWSDIGKIHDYDGTTWRQIAKAYDNDGTTDALIYSADIIMAEGGALASGVTFAKVSSNGNATTSGTEVAATAYSGSNYGYNCSRFSEDVRGYSTVAYEFTTSGNLYTSIGGPKYAPILLLIGTESQLAGVKKTAYESETLNGCAALLQEYDKNQTFSGSVAIDSVAGSATEPVYIGLFIASYNGGTRSAEVSKMIVE